MTNDSQWDNWTEEAQRALSKLGVEVSKEQARLVAEIHYLPVGGQMQARAKLDLVILGSVAKGIDGLAKATDALVESSNNNTDRMEALGKQLNALTSTYVRLTAVIAFFALLQIALAFFVSPKQIVVPAPVVNVAPPIVQVVAPTAQPKPSSPRPPVRAR